MHDDSSRFRYSTGYVFMQIFRLTILRFSSRTFFDFSSDFFSSDFSRFRSSFLSDLYCSEVKLI